MSTKTYSTRLESEKAKVLEKLAEAGDVTVSDVLREAVDLLIARESSLRELP